MSALPLQRLARSASLRVESGIHFVIGFALILCPRSLRFRAALSVAKLLQPALLLRASTRQYRPFDGYREAALQHAYRGMQRLKVQFDPELRVIGPKTIDKGSLILTGHFGLTGIFLRWLFNQGHKVATVMYAPFAKPRVLGTLTPIEVLRADHTVLVRVRRRLAEGGVVVMALDTSQTVGTWRTLDKPGGLRNVNDTAMRFAERANVPVLFCSTRIGDDGNVEATLVQAPWSSATQLFDEFCSFLSSEASKIKR